MVTYKENGLKVEYCRQCHDYLIGGPGEERCGSCGLEKEQPKPETAKAAPAATPETVPATPARQPQQPQQQKHRHEKRRV